MVFDMLLFAVGLLAGATAAVVGFGVGSFLTPVLALRTGFGTAVAAVGVAHFCGSALRCWLLRRSVNRRMLFGFGLLSAAGGLGGALLQAHTSGGALSVVFGCLMVFAGFSGLLGVTERLRLSRQLAWATGAVSGFFGGLVGNQGGLRAVGLLGFSLPKAEFVATATAIALVVDIFRLPVYVAVHGAQLAALAVELTVMVAGVIIGTVAGAPLLRRLPERYFRVILSVVLIAVGVLVAMNLRG